MAITWKFWGLGFDLELTLFTETLQIYLLCIRLLNECYPEFCGVFTSSIDKLTVLHRQHVIDVDVHPFTEPPEAEVNHALIALGT